MNAQVKQGERWRFIGSGDGSGLVHTVVGVVCEDFGEKPVEVFTWSDPVNRAGVGGFAGLFPMRDFLKVFQRA